MTKSTSLYAIFKGYGKNETFTCDGCHHVFGKKWSDDDAIAEMRTRFPGINTSYVLLLCDDCISQIDLNEQF